MFMASRAQSNVTSDHDEIRRWAEARDGQPACVKGTGDRGDIGMLRIDFPGYSGEESLQHISWDEWFDKFDERNLSLLYQETTAGGAQSNFNKLVSKETARAAEASGKSRTGGRSTTRSRSAGSSRSTGHRDGRTKSRASGSRSSSSRSSSTRGGSSAKKTASRASASKRSS